MTLVVDASVACKWFVEELGSPQAAALLEGDEGLIAPEFVIAEVSNALWRKSRVGEMAFEQAEAAVDELPRFFDDLVPSALLAARSLAIAAALDHPVYDSLYVALAELREARLVTADRGLLDRLSGTPWAPRAVNLQDLRTLS